MRAGPKVMAVAAKPAAESLMNGVMTSLRSGEEKIVAPSRFPCGRPGLLRCDLNCRGAGLVRTRCQVAVPSSVRMPATISRQPASSSRAIFSRNQNTDEAKVKISSIWPSART